MCSWVAVHFIEIISILISVNTQYSQYLLISVNTQYRQDNNMELGSALRIFFFKFPRLFFTSLVR